MVNSRQKGARGERDVLAILRTAYGGTWERRPIGYAGSDLITPDWFPYSVEIKNEQCKLRHIVFWNKNVAGWWEQAVRQAQNEGKQPLLVVKCETNWWCIQTFRNAGYERERGDNTLDGVVESKSKISMARPGNAARAKHPVIQVMAAQVPIIATTIQGFISNDAA